MGDKSKIEWTDATWNPIRGCSRISEGCRNCYAERLAARFSGAGQVFEGLATITNAGPRWTGVTRLVDSNLVLPLRWRRPRRVFVNSMSDLFHESVPNNWIDKIFGVMAACPEHTFQILTKRADRMAKYMRHAKPIITAACLKPIQWPLPNVWLGVSVEDQETADARIPLLLQSPAAVRWMSYEPALGLVDLYRGGFTLLERITSPAGKEWPGLNWVVAGGESGPGARPAESDWFRTARDQCQAAGVPFFFKQWGEWMSLTDWMRQTSYEANKWPTFAVQRVAGKVYLRVGKKLAGRTLDGREWDEMPGQYETRAGK